jgi:excisionase family DNA binding protein
MHQSELSPSQIADDELISVALAADIASCSRRTIRRAYASGSLPAHRDGNARRVRVRLGDLRQWMAAESIRGGIETSEPEAPTHPRRSPARSRRSSLALLRSARAGRS